MDISAGVPDTVLGTCTIPSFNSASYDWRVAECSGTISLTATTQYAVMVTNDTGTPVASTLMIRGKTNADYEAGAYCNSSDSGATFYCATMTGSNDDFLFRVYEADVPTSTPGIVATSTSQEAFELAGYGFIIMLLFAGTLALWLSLFVKISMS